MAIRLCACCGLPVLILDRVVTGTSSCGQIHGVLGVCLRCTSAESRLPKAVRFKRMNRALARALSDPSRYLCTVYPTLDAARLAHGLLLQQDIRLQVMKALGWLEQDQTAQN